MIVTSYEDQDSQHCPQQPRRRSLPLTLSPWTDQKIVMQTTVSGPPTDTRPVDCTDQKIVKQTTVSRPPTDTQSVDCTDQKIAKQTTLSGPPTDSARGLHRPKHREADHSVGASH